MATQKVIAAHLDLSQRRVSGLIKEGVLPAAKGPGGLDVDKCRHAYIGYLRAFGSGKIKSVEPGGSGEDFAQLIEEEKYRKIKRENDIEDGLVAPVSLLTDAVVKSANIIMPVLETLPLEIKRSFPEITGGQAHIIKKAIAVCRNAIADMELILE